MKAIAVFQNRVRGHVHFRETPTGSVVVTGTLHCLTPGDHGFHVHTYGNLLDEKCEDCGGHWSVRKSDHGGLNADVLITNIGRIHILISVNKVAGI